MGTPFDLSVPLNISHEFMLTDQLGISADAKTLFKPLALDRGSPVLPTAVTISLKLSF